MRDITLLFSFAFVAFMGGCNSADETPKPNTNANLPVVNATVSPNASPAAVNTNSVLNKTNQEIQNTNRIRREDRDEDRDEDRNRNRNSRESDEDEGRES